MAALGWLLNLDFAGSGVTEAAAAVSGLSQRSSYVHRRKRPYGAWHSMFKVLRWPTPI